MSALERIDCVVVGAGVVGLAVARALAHAGREVLVLERADAPGTETSSRNSEVIHAGIYYPTGSRKARLCVEGRRQLYAYCASRDIAHRRCGKYIVAVTDGEIATLHRYRACAHANGAHEVELVSGDAVRRAEPAVHGVAALWSPQTGIVDSHELMQSLTGDLEAAGGAVALRSEVRAVRLGARGHRLEVQTPEGDLELEAAHVVNAAGLSAPALAARMQGLPGSTVPTAFYAQGHYFTLSGRSPFTHLVYPVATEGGLGVHVTLDLAGAARFGPDVTWVREPAYAFDESRRAAFEAAIRRYYPGLDPARLQPAYVGVRPKISGPGEPPADFRIDGPGAHGWSGLVNLYGIESPGLTASLALAGEVVRELLRPDVAAVGGAA